MWPSSLFSSRACLIESSWWGLWAETCGSWKRHTGSRSHRGTWAALSVSVVRLKVMFFLKLVISWAVNERKVGLFWALGGQERKLWLWFRLHSLTMCYFYSSLFFFAHSVIFLCKWEKWPNFTRLYCVWMWRCNLTKCWSESWVYGLSFQTLVYFHFVYIAFVCVCVCLLVCVSSCNGTSLRS